MQTPTKLTILAIAIVPWLFGCVNAQSGSYDSRTNAYQSSYYEAPELDSLLAPIALYPDTLLSHILIAATYPLEVIQADRWAKANPNLRGDAAINAVNNQNWDASVKALVAFPDVLDRMSQDLGWTENLGDAFLADENAVMASVQRLRNRAYDNGNLAKSDEVRVVRENTVVVIEPRYNNVVYAPYYDTRVVYGDWWWPDYPPVYWYAPAGVSLYHGFYWGPRVSVSSGFFFSSFSWSNRRVMVVDRPHFHRPPPSAYGIAHHRYAQPWRHDPTHRRGMAYRQGPAYDRFGSQMNRPAMPRPQAQPGRDMRPRPDVGRPQPAPQRDHRFLNQRDNNISGQRVNTRPNADYRPDSSRDNLPRQPVYNRNTDGRAQLRPEQQAVQAPSRDQSFRANRNDTQSWRETRPDNQARQPSPQPQFRQEQPRREQFRQEQTRPVQQQERPQQQFRQEQPRQERPQQHPRQEQFRQQQPRQEQSRPERQHSFNRGERPSGERSPRGNER